MDYLELIRDNDKYEVVGSDVLKEINLILEKYTTNTVTF